jgi:predicted permease
MTTYLGPYAWILALTLGPLGAGVLMRRLGVTPRLARALFKVALFACQTPIVLVATWAASVTAGSKYLPFLVLAGWLVTAVAARGASGLMSHRPRERGSFIVAMCLSNHGYTLLGLVAMVLYGQPGIAQATYAQMFVVPFLVLVCFPTGRYYGQGDRRVSPAGAVLEGLKDPRSLPLAATLAGVALNLSGVPRPAAFEPVLRVLVYTGTLVSGLAVGLMFRGFFIRRFFAENAVSFLYRLSAYPLMYFGMAAAVGLDALDTRIMILFGLVPSALFATLVADFFDLDTDLTTSVFMTGTLVFLLAVLPLYVIMGGTMP